VRPVPAPLLSGAGTGAGTGAGLGGGGSASTAIDAWVRSACTAVPPADYAGSTATATTGTGEGALYACSAAT
jgi:hypothetical protein